MFTLKAAAVAVLVLAALAVPIYAAASDAAPFHGSESGTFRLSGGCGAGGVVVEVTGVGRGTQVGNYRVDYSECFVPATGAVTDGSFTLTAANGDVLSGTYGGRVSPTADPNVIAFDDPGVVTGGTGRFAAASGSITQSGVANPATGRYTASLVGSIATVGSR